MNITPIRIAIKKGRLFLYLIGTLLLVAAGILILAVSSESPDNWILDSYVFTIAIALLCIVFFGYGSYLFAIKLVDKRPGLIIDNQGITDNATSVVNGLIPWEDVFSFVECQVKSNKFIMVYVLNPQEYIDKQTSFIKRKSMEANLKTYGTSVFINMTFLAISQQDLLDKLNQRLDQYRS